MYKRVLHIAIPSIITNITVPLLSIVDTAITGHLGSTAYIGAIAVGGSVFSMIYWIFGFLRAGTGGLTAQAAGAGRRDICESLLSCSLGVGLLTALSLWILQAPLSYIAFSFLGIKGSVAYWAQVYFNILIWGAPAVMCLYGLNGWFVGMQNTRYPLVVALVQNLGNIILSIIMVYGFGMKVDGVALGTLIAQYLGLISAFILAYKMGYRMGWQKGLVRMGQFFAVNRDIFLRTICLVAVTVYFTKAGAGQSEDILAINTLLIEFFMLFSYVMDGFAYAAEAVGGHCYGAHNTNEFKQMLKIVFRLGFALSILFTILYGLFGKELLQLFTDNLKVLVLGPSYLPYIAVLPLLSFAAFLFDGVMIGITATRAMLISMGVATISFFTVWTFGHETWSNDALWVAFLSYLLLRGLMQGILLPRIVAKWP